MSIRNIDADIASNKLNELFHLHRYEDCVLFINRLSHSTVKLIISQISIDMFLARLPYTIEIFESLYAKTFIMDPENFPVRHLKPEKIVDKMVAYFSLLNQNQMEPIDGAKMLDSFENVIRIISYVQPNLYSRLLYFKYAIDKGLMRLELDLAQFKKNSTNKLNNMANVSDYQSIDFSDNSTIKNDPNSINALKNALLVSRVTTMQSCEQIRLELGQTLQNCEKALNKLNDHVSSLKSQKIFKEALYYMNQHQNTTELEDNTNKASSKSPKVAKRLKNSSSTSSVKKKTTPKNQEASLSTSEIDRLTNSEFKKVNQIENSSQLFKPSSICQDFIQNRLYLNKAMMNTIEPFLEKIKLQQFLNNLYEKIDLDKEILLVFTHLKREEKYLSSVEPLQPLFRRYSLGFERCIQIWRKKCSADSLLLFNEERTLSQNDQFSSINKNDFKQELDQLYILDNCESNQLDHMHSSYAGSPLVLSKMNKQYSAHKQQQVNRKENAVISDIQVSPNHQKFRSELNLTSNPIRANYSTMPAKFKAHNRQIAAHSDSNRDVIESNNLKEQKEIVTKKNVQSQTDLEIITKNEINAVIEIGEKTDFLDIDSAMSEEKNKVEVRSTKSENRSNYAFKNELSLENKIDDPLLVKANAQEKEIYNLNIELETSKETITILKKNESNLKERLKELEQEQEILLNKINKKSDESDNYDGCRMNKKNFNLVNNYQYTSDLIQLYNNLNNKYRYDAYESLGFIKEIQNMTEFKLKLLFSVVVLSFRYVKSYIRDLKRKIKSLLQINERYNSTERSSSQKSQYMTPTIIVQKPEETIKCSNQNSEQEKNTNEVFFNENSTKIKEKKSSNINNSKHLSRHSLSEQAKTNQVLNSAQFIENSLVEYFQMATLNNTFDLYKIVEEVKEQLWTTLHEYPLRDCQELNSYINESVKTCWSLINHFPPFKIDYSSNRYDSRLHEREESSNKLNDQITQYAWPSLVDTSDNSCLSKGIVIT